MRHVPSHAKLSIFNTHHRHTDPDGAANTAPPLTTHYKVHKTHVSYGHAVGSKQQHRMRVTAHAGKSQNTPACTQKNTHSSTHTGGRQHATTPQRNRLQACYSSGGGGGFRRRREERAGANRGVWGSSGGGGGGFTTRRLFFTNNVASDVPKVLRRGGGKKGCTQEG